MNEDRQGIAGMDGFQQPIPYPTPTDTVRQNPISHPSLDGHSRKIVTRELVYYVLLGTLRSAQKCLWSNLRVEFSRDIHP